MKDGFLSLFYPQGLQRWLGCYRWDKCRLFGLEQHPGEPRRSPRAGLSIPAQRCQRRAGSSPLGALFLPSGHEKDQRGLIPRSINTKQTQPRCYWLLLIRLCVLRFHEFFRSFPALSVPPGCGGLGSPCAPAWGQRPAASPPAKNEVAARCLGSAHPILMSQRFLGGSSIKTSVEGPGLVSEQSAGVAWCPRCQGQCHFLPSPVKIWMVP